MSVWSALRYAELGWHVVPVDRQERPLYELDLATHSERDIRDWWTVHPKAGVAVVLGPSGLAAVVIETREALAVRASDRAAFLGKEGTYPLMKTRRGLIAFFKSDGRTARGTLGPFVVLSGLVAITLPPTGGVWLTSPFTVAPPRFPSRIWTIVSKLFMI